MYREESLNFRRRDSANKIGEVCGGPHPRRRAATWRNLSHAREEWRLVDTGGREGRRPVLARMRGGMRHSARSGERVARAGSDNRERTVTGTRANQEGWRRPGGRQGASACDRWTRGRHIDPSFYDLLPFLQLSTSSFPSLSFSFCFDCRSNASSSEPR